MSSFDSWEDVEHAEVVAAARHFADIWAELMIALPDDYGCEMNCAEANAAADLYRALGYPTTAAAIVAAHTATDNDEELEAHDETPGKDRS